MQPSDLLISPVTIMVFALALVYLVYAWSRKVAPVVRSSVNKTMPYIGGEAVEAQVYQPGYQFFYVALFFTVVHVAAMVIVIAPSDAPLLATLGYLLIVGVSIIVMRWEP
jgi:hypothetical protein